MQRQYVDALIREIGAFCPGDRGFSGAARVSSVFFGGGTPSILPASWIGEILGAVRTRFSVEEGAEISIEANPGTVREEDLRQYREMGMNRISFGLQSTDDRELERLGRIHSYAQFLENYFFAREAGFDNINVDLMSAIPGQTESSWERTLHRIGALAPEHVSAYSLIIEENTVFYAKYADLEKRIEQGIDAGELSREEAAAQIPPEDRLPDEETERRMYERTGEILSGYGYRQYEISNYAKKGRACRHNIGYWTGVPYIGFGLGASSYTGKKRYRNTEDLNAYLSGDAGEKETEVLTLRDRMAEFMILGLRMTAGVEKEEFRNRFRRSVDSVYGDVLDKYENAGLLRDAGGRISLTRAGISLSNTVMADFL